MFSWFQGWTGPVAEPHSTGSQESECLAEVSEFAGLAWRDLIPRTAALSPVGVPLTNEGGWAPREDKTLDEE